MGFYVTRDTWTQDYLSQVWYSSSKRRRKDGMPYDQDILGDISYYRFSTLFGIKLACGERKHVELVEVRERSR